MEEDSNVNNEVHHHKEDSGSITLKKDTLWKAGTFIFAALFVISLFTGGFGLKNTGNAIAPNPSGNVVAPTQPTVPTAPVKVSLDDDAVLGNKNAKVTIVEFSDYECPFCGRHFSETYPQIKSQYIDTGKVKLVFRDFPLSFHQSAQKAAEAAECAGEQGKYFEMHDKLYQNQQTLSVENEKKWAKEIGLDQGKFDKCLDSGQMAGEIAKDMADGQSYGVQGTPGFFINGKPISGAQPFSVFQQAIEAELNA